MSPEPEQHPHICFIHSDGFFTQVPPDSEDSLIVLSRLVWALHKTVLLVLAKLFNRDKAPCHFSLTPPNSFKCHRSAVSWCRPRQQFLNPVTLFGFLKRGPWLCFCIFHPPLDGIRRVGFRSPTRFSVCGCLFPGGKLWCTVARQRLRSKVASRAAFTPNSEQSRSHLSPQSSYVFFPLFPVPSRPLPHPFFPLARSDDF